MEFNGFPRDTTKFLMDLSKNNSRDWFTKNKTRYMESVDIPAKVFIRAMGERLSELVSQPMAGKIFRIYRDLRFSKDRTPYNAHIRMLFHSVDVESTCGDKPVFCFSLEPDRIITGTGTGTMEFSKDTLEKFRTSVATDKSGNALAKLLSKYTAKDNYRIDPPALKRIPAGLDKAHQRESLLRHKALMVWHESPLFPEIYSGKITKILTSRYAKMKPVYVWIDSLS